MLVEIVDLRVAFGSLVAVDGVSLSIAAGSRVGLVGESGAGKSLTGLAVAGLLPAGAHATGTVEFDGANILGLGEGQLARLRGSRIASVFQDPLTALNPVVRVGEQIAEMFRMHRGASRKEAVKDAVEALSRVGFPDAQVKARAYPHQLSGGQRQRVLIAIAMSCSPQLLIADEPTTALDVTIQAEILKLLDALVAGSGGALLFISHDLPVVATLCDIVYVMYGGRVVESGPVDTVLQAPRHPYTSGLLEAQPSAEATAQRRRLPVIPGVVPALGSFPTGCVFRDRCGRAVSKCAEPPALISDGDHAFACWNPLDVADVA